MRWVSRAEWGARRPRSVTRLSGSQGLTFHYVGPRLGPFGHDQCARRVRDIQGFHMDSRRWADIAYNTLTCPHGWVFEGRGWFVRSAANGTNVGNASSYANCHLCGDGDPLTLAGEQAMRDVLHAARTTGRAGPRVWVHQDWKSTGCPGNAVTRFVRSGLAGAAPPPTPTPTPKEIDVKDAFMFWHKGGLYLAWNGKRTVGGLPGHVADEFTKAGVPRVGKPDDVSAFFNELPLFK